MPLEILRASALPAYREPVVQLLHQPGQVLAVRLKFRGVGSNLALNPVQTIYQPQQSVLKPHAGQRQTACMRYISALAHRSQIIASSRQGVAFAPAEALAGSSNGVGEGSEPFVGATARIIGCIEPKLSCI